MNKTTDFNLSTLHEEMSNHPEFSPTLPYSYKTFKAQSGGVKYPKIKISFECVRLHDQYKFDTNPKPKTNVKMLK